MGESAPAIQMSGVGKQYRRGIRREGYETLRESVVERIGALARRARGAPGEKDSEPFWALKDVFLEVPHGAALGLIGPNGAGKSTLLKILSRVTEPTTGEVRLDGRVGSLLEVGTGFHPELTGRENVLLNGAILGMRRREVLAKFDAIVSFAEVEPFIDTPVKHYSSGMYLRLAFAVAAHLEPEILLVDEVLAVGDAAFQKRCLGKMNEVARGGRTVVFVSHNLEAIQRLCSHAVMLERGSVVAAGDTASVIARYLATDYQRPAPDVRIDLSELARAGTGGARFATAMYAGGTADRRPSTNEALEFLLDVDSNATRPVRSLAVFLTDPFGTKVLNADTLHVGRTVLLERGRNAIRLRIRALHLVPGIYRVGLWLADPVHAQSVSGAFDYIESAFEIEVTRPPSASGAGTGGLVPCEFEVEELH